MHLLTDQKVMELLGIIDANPEGVAIDDLLAQSEHLDINQLLEFLSDFNYEVMESSGVRRIISKKEGEKADYQFSPLEQFFVFKLEKLIGMTATVSFVSGIEQRFLIHRVLFNEGKISFLGESCETGFLQLEKVAEVSALSKFDGEYDSKYSVSQIDEFLSELRGLSENEVRLVLKVKEECSIDITPRYHFLKKPYAISNVDGDKIWAATVELNDDIYAWLVSIQPHVEILDPTLVKRGVLKYCQDRLEEIAFQQKVS